MLSRGGKIEYSCPNCRSVNIGKVVRYKQHSGECRTCLTWWPWRNRLKTRVVSK